MNSLILILFSLLLSIVLSSKLDEFLERDDWESIKEHLQAREGINEAFRRGLILHDPTLLNFVLDQVPESDLFASFEDDFSPLTLAIMTSNAEKVAIMLAKGFDPNMRDTRDGETPLMTCVMSNNIESIPLILAYGGEVNLQDDSGNTALILAAIDRRYDATRMLLEAGAETDLVAADGTSALMHACSHADHGIIELLLAHGANVNLSDNVGFTALSMIEYGDYDLTEMLLDRGADINIVDSQGNTVLMKTVYREDPSTFELLIERGADVNVVNLRGNTVLNFAVDLGCPDRIQFLLDHGADIRNIHGQPPLIAALESQSLNIPDLILISEILLRNGADVNACDKDGNSPLMLAVERNNIDLVELFLNHDASITSTNNTGRTVLPFAIQQGNLEIVELLLQVATGDDLNTVDGKGNTAHMYACRGQHFELVKVLLNRGACIAIENRQGDSPIEFARRNHMKRLVRLLIERE